MFNTQNGRATQARPPIQLGDFLPETATVSINGQDFTAWVVSNRRYPRSVMAQLDRASAHYRRATDAIRPLSKKEEDELDEQERAQRLLERQYAVDDAGLAYQRFLTDCLCALIKGLDEETAELIDVEPAEQLLRDLGYFRARESSVSTTESEGQADATPLTGDTSPVDSPTSTQDIPSPIS